MLKISMPPFNPFLLKQIYKLIVKISFVTFRLVFKANIINKYIN